MKNFLLIFTFMVCFLPKNVFGQNTFSLSEFNQIPSLSEPKTVRKVPYKGFIFSSDRKFFDVKNDAKPKNGTKKGFKNRLDSLQSINDSLTIRNFKMTQKQYRMAFEEIDENYYQFKNSISDLEEKLPADSAAKADKDFKTLLKLKKDNIDTDFDSLQTLRNILLDLMNHPDSLNIKKMDDILKKSQSRIEALEGNLAKIGKKLSLVKGKTQAALETLPTLVATSAFFVPTVNLFGSYVNSKDGLAVNIQLFKGGTGSDSLPYNNLRRLLVPQASSLGISLGINKSLFSEQNDDSKRIGISSNFYFLFKDIPNHQKNKDVPSINTAMFQNTTNIDFTPIKGAAEAFNMYAGWNFIWVLNQRDNLNSYFGVDNHNFINYFNVGFRLNIPLVGDSSNIIVIDINNLFINDNLRKLYKTTDAVIPLISIGVKRSIAKF
jgi:hypothetical protein